MTYPLNHSLQPGAEAHSAAAPLQSLREEALSLGFPLFGVSAPRLALRYRQRFSEWLEQGAHAEMGYLARRAAERLDPLLLMPEARSVIVLATPYVPQRVSSASAKIARYALSDDYHEVIGERLRHLRTFIEQRYPPHRVYAEVDTGPVLERAFAEQAGLGWIGKNGNLISKRYGSYLFLATLFTTLPLEPSLAPHPEHCGTCTACLSGCPTQAIPKPGYVDARRCIAYWTIEHRGELPAQAPDLEGWLFGCDICQEVCPWNRFAQAPLIPELAQGRAFPQTASEWLALSDDEMARILKGSSLKRTKAQGIRRNAQALLKVVSEDEGVPGALPKVSPDDLPH